MPKVKKIPQRQCVGCREMKDKKALLRVVKSPEGTVSLDFGHRFAQQPGHDRIVSVLDLNERETPLVVGYGLLHRRSAACRKKEYVGITYCLARRTVNQAARYRAVARRSIQGKAEHAQQDGNYQNPFHRIEINNFSCGLSCPGNFV